MGTDLQLFIALMLLVTIQKICFARDAVNSTHFLRDGDAIVSSGGIFELGFFSPNNSSNRYVGIWYKKVPTRTVVWVANRDTPITNSSSVVFGIIDPGRLALVDGKNSIVWNSSSTSTSVKSPVAKLLDSGNLVITDDANEENFVWQSFEHPTDTLLPGMTLGKNFLTGLEINLSAWKTENNPGSGEYKLYIESTGYPQLIISNGGEEWYRSGPWNGLRWSGTPGVEIKEAIGEASVIFNATGDFVSYKIFKSSTLLRIVLSSSGNLIKYLWAEETQVWNVLRQTPTDVCDRYGYCGTYGSCNYDNYPVCGCLDKFLPKNQVEWGRSEFSGGCVRKTRLSSCQNGSSSDGFLKYSGIKLPDTKFSWFNRSMNLQECEQVCLKNCSCTAYSSLDISYGENGCLLWFGDLIDIRVLSQEGQDIFIRMASSSSDLDYASRSKGKKLKIIKLSSSLSIALLVISLTLIVIFYKQKRKRKKEIKLKLEEDQTLFEASTITKATDNFSLKNKIGEGGYGPVYKGVLGDGREIAVKRLSKTSMQGFEEFKNEVNFIAKLQHRNLVKLLGWCIKGDEKMLIYEYMPNKSLDSFIFDQTRRTLLDWTKRFNIINGIARGLLYLHQDSRLRIIHRDLKASRLRIIHRDLKASNILLDIDMNPKISDFGLARSIGGNETGAKTSRVAGTHGYMSPEYAGNGMFSTKSDVFSFGVSVLEIVSGKRNRGFSDQDHYENLPSYAWKLYRDGRSIELVDEHLVELCDLPQVLRSIHVGLLCVQQHPEDRPSMFSTVQMLSNDANLPVAKEPGFFTGREIDSQISTDTNTTCSINDVSISLFSPR